MIDLDNYNELMTMQEKYYQALMQRRGLRSFSRLLNEITGCPLYIMDSYEDDFVYADRELKNEEFFEYIDKRQIKNAKTIFSHGNFTLERIIYKSGDKFYNELKANLGDGEKRTGVLNILEKQEIDEEKYIYIMQAAYALAIKINQIKLVHELAQKCSSELIEDLLNGRLMEKEELIKKGELAGWDLTVPYQLYTISFETLKNDKGDEKYYLYQLRDRVIRNLHWIIKTNISRKYITFVYEDKILLLINYPEFNDSVRHEIELVSQKLIKRFSKLNFYISSGTFITNCLGIPESYQQAVQLLDFMLSTGQKNKVLFYNDLGIMRLLWEVDQDKLTAFAREFLDRLVKYDTENNSDLLNTLGVYLEEGGSIKQAADRLYIHSNTMSYRMKKIQEIMELDVKDIENQHNLLTAYKIHKHIKLN